MKRFLFILPLFIVIAFPFSLHGQKWLWAKSAGGLGDDEGWSASVGIGGNVFVAGYFDDFTLSFGSTVFTNNDPSGNTNDLFIAKYDSSGNMLWAKSAGGIYMDEAFSVSADASGNVYLTGYFDSPSITFGTTTLTNVWGSTADIFIVKYDANGNVVWAKSAGGLGDDVANAVSIDANGNVFVTGWFNSPTIYFGSTTLTNSNGNDNIFIVKYDANGNVLWAKNAGGLGNGDGYSTSADANGNVFVTGEFYSPTITFGSTTLTNADQSGNTEDVFIAKYDMNGNVLWANRAGGTNHDEGYSISTDPSGSVFVTGWFDSPTIAFGPITITNASSRNVFIAKYDANGNVLWAKGVGGGLWWVKGYSVSADGSGNVYVSGWFSSPNIIFGSDTLTPPAGSTDPMFIVKYDANGNVLCASALASGGDDNNGISADPFGNVYVGADFEANPFIVGSTTLTLTPTGTENIFVAKWTCGCNITASANGNTTICSGQTAMLNANPAGATYSWSNGSTANIIPVSPTSTSTYSVIVSYESCSDTAKVTVIVKPLPTPSIIGNTNICSGQSVTLTASGGINYSWNTGDTTQTVSITPPSTTNYTVAVKDNNGCLADTVFTVVVNPNPIAAVSSSITIFQGHSTTLIASGDGNYLWNTGETTTVISVAPTVTTIYCVTVADTNNCTNTACATVTIESPCDTAGAFFFPNAFSPNGDNENDFLKIYYNEMNCIKTLHLIIYQRWGEKVYETTDPNFQWDGGYNGTILNTQVLAYYLSVKFTDSKEIERKGNISLVR